MFSCRIPKVSGEMAELVEGARLEIVFTRNRNKGSNPFLSAKAARCFRCRAVLFRILIIVSVILQNYVDLSYLGQSYLIHPYSTNRFFNRFLI